MASQDQGLELTRHRGVCSQSFTLSPLQRTPTFLSATKVKLETHGNTLSWCGVGGAIYWETQILRAAHPLSIPVGSGTPRSTHWGGTEERAGKALPPVSLLNTLFALPLPPLNLAGFLNFFPEWCRHWPAGRSGCSASIPESL